VADTKNTQHILLPCRGIEHLNILRGHVYLVKDKDSNKELGFITKQNARIILGSKNYLTYDIESLCPLCKTYTIRDLKMTLIEK